MELQAHQNETEVPELIFKLQKRILSSLLPAQQEFVEDSSHRILGYIGGFGSGKTFALVAKLVFLGLANPACTLMALEPIYPMIRTVFMPTFEALMEQWAIKYTFRASDMEYTMQLPNGKVKVLLQSAENWQRIRGQNLAAAVWDECDSSQTMLAQKASEMLLARMRTGQLNQLAVASTPEGFRWAYQTFVEREAQDKRLIQVNTMDNPHLPVDYVSSLEANYPSRLIQAYLQGRFVNMAASSVYPDFERDLNISTISSPTEDDILWVGMDFNVDRCWMVVIVQRGGDYHIIAEHIARDTPACKDVLHEHYSPWIRAQQLIVCPDASAQSRSSQSAGISDVGLLKAPWQDGSRLRLQYQAGNPFIKDRVLSVNTLVLNGLGERHLLVHPKCRGVVRGFEQQSYDLQTQQPQKGDGGVDDLSGQMDALGYAIWQLAGIKPWITGRTRIEVW